MTDVVALRRDLHAHPEVGYAEHRTTALICRELEAVGLHPQVLGTGTGVVCDVGSGTPAIALRADIDALPIQDLSDTPYRSVNDGVCHGCGHDAHTAILLAAAGQLAADPPPGGIRLIFQPAEEMLPGGAHTVTGSGWLRGIRRIFALHCDPRLDTGRIGVRVGAITAACDEVEVLLKGPGGHTSRPQLTADVVYALGRLITDVPGLLTRRVDPRAALSLVWGAVQAGQASNAIPAEGRLLGTIRVFDREVWRTAEPLIRSLIAQVVAPTEVQAELDYRRGVPPVMNDAECVALQREAIDASLGPDALADTEQSMGGEDFAWYLDTVPGALARLGVRIPGRAPFDLHQGSFDIDERALDVGVRYTVALARATIAAG